MPKRRDSLLREDILNAAGKIRSYLADTEGKKFLADTKTIDAVVRNLEVIGEAARMMSPEGQTLYPKVPWTQVVGLRHRIVHEYFGIDPALVWQIASVDVPELEKSLGEK